VPTNDPAVSEATMYIGPRTSITLQPGTTFGEADADLVSNGLYGNTIFQLGGDVISVNPASYKNNTCAPGLHAAVWLARMTPLFLNASIRIPIYVDSANPSEAPYASYRLKTCFPSPYVPFPDGEIFGGRLLDFQLYLTNFVHAGDSRWTTVVTPFANDGTPDPQGAGQAQSLVTQGSISILKVKRIAKKHGKHTLYFAHVQGRVTTKSGVGISSHVQIFQLFTMEGGPEVAARNTDVNGNFSVTVRQKRSAFYGILASELGNTISPPVCSPVLNIGFGPLPCASLTNSDFQSARVSKKVRIPRHGVGISATRANVLLHRLALREAGKLSR
jgi:hypothetical protein